MNISEQVERLGADSLLPPKKYKLELTERELWYLREGYEASFTEPEAMNPIERMVGQKLTALFKRAARDKQR